MGSEKEKRANEAYVLEVQEGAPGFSCQLELSWPGRCKSGDVANKTMEPMQVAEKDVEEER